MSHAQVSLFGVNDLDVKPRDKARERIIVVAHDQSHRIETFYVLADRDLCDSGRSESVHALVTSETAGKTGAEDDGAYRGLINLR
jgi:hypothetical protein